MRSPDTGKIVLGLVIFIILVTFPIWYGAVKGDATARPELVYPTGETSCVESAEYMRALHMELLNHWRTSVVRRSVRTYTATDGHHYDMSLQNTCMKCHQDKAKFCDRCHSYAGVQPGCWDCHVEPKGAAR